GAPSPGQARGQGAQAGHQPAAVTDAPGGRPQRNAHELESQNDVKGHPGPGGTGNGNRPGQKSRPRAQPGIGQDATRVVDPQVPAALAGEEKMDGTAHGGAVRNAAQ